MSDFSGCKLLPDSGKMLEIIRAQSEITKAGPDLGSIMNAVCEQAQLLVDADGATVELAEDDEMVYRAVSGSLSSYLGLRLKKGTSLSGMCVGSCNIMYCKDSTCDERVNKAACLQVGAVSLLVVPLKHEEECVGVLKVTSSRPDFFTETDMCVLSLIADMLGSSIYNASRNDTEELFKKATTDFMTGLSNRAAFYDELRRKVTLSRRSALSFGVLILDMDGLKYINDNFGHLAGDAAINEFAFRIRSASRENDTVARLGGDEFGIIGGDIKNNSDGNMLTDRLYAEIERPFSFEDNPLPFSGSIGYAIFPHDSEDMQALIDIADKAMYKVKKERKVRNAVSL